MTVRWLVDDDATAILWRELADLPLRLADGPGNRVLDLGGGNGNFVTPLLPRKAYLVTADADRDSLRQAYDGIRPVGASVLRLPFRDGAFDGIAGRAILHHVPDELDAVLAEANRVVKPGGLVLFEEPTNGNLLAKFARRAFPTERHDPGERPLATEAYVAALRRQFEVLEVRAYFLVSYLLPHLAGRLPRNRRALARAMSRTLFVWDTRFLKTLPRLRRHAAYIAVLARRPRDTKLYPSEQTL